MFALKMKFLSFGHLRSLFCSERETFKRQHAGYFPHFFFFVLRSEHRKTEISYGGVLSWEAKTVSVVYMEVLQTVFPGVMSLTQLIKG